MLRNVLSQDRIASRGVQVPSKLYKLHLFGIRILQVHGLFIPQREYQVIPQGKSQVIPQGGVKGHSPNESQVIPQVESKVSPQKRSKSMRRRHIFSLFEFGQRNSIVLAHA